MKNLFTVIFCMTLCMLVLSACGKQQADIVRMTLRSLKKKQLQQS